MPKRGVSSLSARFLVRAAGLLILRRQRGEWREEWLGELIALEEQHAQGTTGLPGLVAYALGAIPHALCMKTEGWTMDSMLQDLRFSTRGGVCTDSSLMGLSEHGIPLGLTSEAQWHRLAGPQSTPEPRK